MSVVRRSVLCLVAVLVLGMSAAWSQEKVSHGNFKEVQLYRPAGEATSFVLFLSGEGGWTPTLGSLAQALAAQGALVAGIDAPRMLAAVGKDSGDCLLPDGDLENLSHFLQGYARLPAYFPPLLVGQAAGGALAYAMLAQAPRGTFGGAISMGFCPQLALRKPLCKADGASLTVASDGARRGFALLPVPRLPAPWVVLQSGEDPTACTAAQADAFVSQVAGARQVPTVPGANHPHLPTGQAAALPPLLVAHRELAQAAAPPPAPAPDAGVADLPLVPVPGPDAGAAGDTFAVLLSGDGGWAGIDKQLADKLAAAGVPVVGLDSLRYFWSARTPQGLAQDLDRVLHSYAARWKKRRALLIGYSQGADVLPFAVNRLSEASRQLVAHTVLIGPGERASFEFRLSNWLTRDKGGLPLRPELQTLSAQRTLCIYGSDDRDAVCPRVPAGQVTAVPLPGNHHFDGVYDVLTRTILQRTQSP